MKTKLKLIAICHLLTAICFSAFAQGTAFTYQGQLQNNGSPASGSYNLTFSLFNVNPGGTALAGPVTTNGVIITNGLFMVTLDFGASVWNGETNWLQIGVETNGTGSFTTLAPRQQLTPTPYAIFAEGANASGISGTIPAGNLGGTYGGAVNFNNGANSFDGSFYGAFYGSSFVGGTFVGDFVGNGSGLTDVWQTTGNSGTTAGANFLGTTDNQPLELHVSGQRVLRLELNSPDAPNIIGGYGNNFVAAGVSGATIAGGGLSGSTNRIIGVGYNGAIGGGRNNAVTSFNGVVAGGANNLADANAATVGGGSENYAGGDHDTISGGQYNNTTNGYHTTISGGLDNTNSGPLAVVGGGEINFIGSAADHATIAGGYNNTILGSSGPVSCTIGGGNGNSIQASVAYATISGGTANTVMTSAYTSTIGGGTNNIIQSSDTAATISGGAQNSISANAADAVISGGLANTNGGFASSIGGGEQNNTSGGDGSVIGGGYSNTNNGSAATVGGGQNNAIIGPADHATISGGGGNNITGSAALPVFGTIGGGENNSIQTNTSFAMIGGGITNAIWSGAHGAVIGGGSGNQVLGAGQFSAVGGGANNTNLAPFATIPGGVGNLAGANAFAAGTGAQAGNQGSFVWSDASGGSIGSTLNNSVTMRAAGGYRLFSNAGATLGVSLAANGSSWSSVSDKNAKKNFAPVDGKSILEKLAAIPIEQWNYKSEKDGDTPNIGPMAQDFKHAFYPGRDDKSISTLEFDGVELAAIQGLNQKLDKKDAEIEQLKQSIAQLQALVAQLAKAQSK